MSPQRLVNITKMHPTGNFTIIQSQYMLIVEKYTYHLLTTQIIVLQHHSTRFLEALSSPLKITGLDENLGK